MFGMVRYGTAWYGICALDVAGIEQEPLCLVTERDHVWYGTVWYGMVWYGMVRHGMFVNCNWWTLGGSSTVHIYTHTHTHNTQNNTVERNTQNGTYITIITRKHNNKNT